MNYVVKKAQTKVELGQWDTGAWQDVSPLDITLYMGEKPAHAPKTQAKVLYDASAIYVVFRVEDRYVRAVAGHQESVCRDSCVEFFFIPGTDISKGYFNVEMNCGGNMLFHYQTVPLQGKEIAKADCDQVQVYHQLPSRIDPEIAEPTTWIVAYKLPVDILKKYSPVSQPAPGVVWLANFYKCADSTSHPHWLTWSKVDRPQPNFHVPENFTQITFQ